MKFWSLGIKRSWGKERDDCREAQKLAASVLLEIEETKPIRKLFSLEAKLLRDEEGVNIQAL